MGSASAGIGTGRGTVRGKPPAGRLRPAALLLAVLALAACARPEFATGPNPLARPQGLPPVQDAAAQQDALTAFYAGVEGDLTASGRMRRETAFADAPFTVDDLVRNF